MLVYSTRVENPYRVGFSCQLIHVIKFEAETDGVS